MIKVAERTERVRPVELHGIRGSIVIRIGIDCVANAVPVGIDGRCIQEVVTGFLFVASTIVIAILIEVVRIFVSIRIHRGR